MMWRIFGKSLGILIWSQITDKRRYHQVQPQKPEHRQLHKHENE